MESLARGHGFGHCIYLRRAVLSKKILVVHSTGLKRDVMGSNPARDTFLSVPTVTFDNSVLVCAQYCGMLVGWYCGQQSVSR